MPDSLRHQCAITEQAGDPGRTAVSITGHVHGDQVSLSIAGQIDASNAERVRAVLSGHIDGRTRMIVDLSGLTFIDCAGLAVLRLVIGHVRDSGGAVRLQGVRHPSVRRLIELTGVEVGAFDGEAGGHHQADALQAG